MHHKRHHHHRKNEVYTAPHTSDKCKFFMTDENILVTDALLAANDHLSIEAGDTVHPSQITAPITQEMLDADPTLAERGLRVGDILNAPAPAPEVIEAHIEVTISTDGKSFSATLSNGLEGSFSGSVLADSLSGEFAAALPVKE
jgi:hypothetical protein